MILFRGEAGGDEGRGGGRWGVKVGEGRSEMERGRRERAGKVGVEGGQWGWRREGRAGRGWVGVDRRRKEKK